MYTLGKGGARAILVSTFIIEFKMTNKEDTFVIINWIITKSIQKYLLTLVIFVKDRLFLGSIKKNNNFLSSNLKQKI